MKLPQSETLAVRCESRSPGKSLYRESAGLGTLRPCKPRQFPPSAKSPSGRKPRHSFHLRRSPLESRPDALPPNLTLRSGRARLSGAGGASRRRRCVGPCRPQSPPRPRRTRAACAHRAAARGTLPGQNDWRTTPAFDVQSTASMLRSVTRNWPSIVRPRG
jgi:hypothetical protein